MVGNVFKSETKSQRDVHMDQEIFSNQLMITCLYMDVPPGLS
jgi:hypothetical protein